MNIKYLEKSSKAKVGADVPQDLEDNGMEVTVVGKGFKSGKETDSRIADLLRDETTPAPRFCNDAGACLDALDTLGVTAFVKPTVAGHWVVVFDSKDTLMVTTPFKKDAHALAAALLFVLEYNKSVLS